MNKNELITLQIEDMSHEGAGIGHLNGCTFFVKDAVMGDRVEALVTKVKKNYCFARVKTVVEPSPFRVEPSCPQALRCGGCQMQQLSYDRQLKLKQDIVTNNLVRIGGFDRELIERKMLPIVGMDKPFRYRNKAQVPVGEDREGNIIMGYYGAHSHRIVPMPKDDCILGPKINQKILGIVRDFMREFNIPAYDEESQRGLVRHVLIRQGDATGEIMVCIVINGAGMTMKEVLAERLVKEIPQIKSVCLNMNTRRDNVILGDITKCIWGKLAISDSINVVGKDISFEISANSFYQVNHSQMEKLYGIAVDFAGLTGSENVWDLYCGIGTISLAMATRAGQVYGVEIVPQAIENAKNNAVRNGITNTEFFVGKAEEVLPEYYNNSKDKDQRMLRPDVIVVDPPRKGCDEACLGTMLQMKPDRIVYVSCDSATLARDLKKLTDNTGYRIERLQVVDQFCHSMHTETVCLLSIA